MISREISKRVSYSEQDNVLVIVISGKIEKWKEHLLLLWLIAWTFCGIYITAQLWDEYPRDTKLGMAIYLCFWLYFEVKVGKAYLWRRWGEELIRMKDKTLTIKRSVKSYGKARHYDIENIKKFEEIEYGDRSIKKAYANSFWVIGGERLQFTYLGKVVLFGMQLSKKETHQLIKLMGRKLN